MKRLVACLAGLLSAVAAGCVSTKSLLAEMRWVGSPGSEAALTWEVENRHRLINGKLEQARFEKDLATYIEEYRHWFKAEESVGIFANARDTDLLHARSKLPPSNYSVNYDPGTNSYRCRDDDDAPTCRDHAGDWIVDRSRRVVLNFGTGQCRWTIGGVEDTSDASCAKRRINVTVDQEVPVRALRRQDGLLGETTVLARDIVILALGDSFSAGEGNPHRQWRLGGQPAAWLDARCHRSLMSGPALTAAYLARTNPHTSVTLLHYGCSGSSVADGLVTPWSQLETAADIRRQYAEFGFQGDAFDALRVATVRPQLHDVPLSQLQQAQADLTVDGRLLMPDFIIISVGGNDIGFAKIVMALANEDGTDVDLKADVGAGGLEQVKDHRPYASFDQASWVQSARNVPCMGIERITCMSERVRDRIAGASGHQNRSTLMSQYRELASALQPLTGQDAGRVFMTHYPTFVMREGKGIRPDEAEPEQAEGCHDSGFDGRPGLVPGILAFLPGVGVDGAVAERAEESFLSPLNGAIDEAAGRFGWNVVSTHVKNGITHGYCSLHRYYNTIVDSYWDQGRRYETGRPLGNLVILQPDNQFHLPVGSRVIWDAARLCFVAYPEQAECVPPPHTMPVLELRRDVEPGAGLDDMLAKASTAYTTGPVHPNLFGHCNYAAAILTSLVRQRPDVSYGQGLILEVGRSGLAGLKADDICDPGKWGYRHDAAH